MSSSIWTQCAESFEPRPLELLARRVVESQSHNATRKLVDSDAEQALLEDLIESAKPPQEPPLQDLHFLLATPFRYPPLRYGSRFGTRHERGIWYGAIALHTALAEVAYYRLRFLEDSAAELGTVTVELTAFSVPIRASRAADLTAPPFDRFQKSLRHRTDYAQTQALGLDLRAAKIQAFTFASARDPKAGLAVALFEPVFAARKPTLDLRVRCCATRQAVEFSSSGIFERQQVRFDRECFEVEGLLPKPSA